MTDNSINNNLLEKQNKFFQHLIIKIINYINKRDIKNILNEILDLNEFIINVEKEKFKIEKKLESNEKELKNFIDENLENDQKIEDLENSQTYKELLTKIGKFKLVYFWNLKH